MKKTILTIMVAAMMLVAFTACEQQMPTYKNADFISVNQTTAFIKGQPFDASYFTVTLHYTDGSTSTVGSTGIVSAPNWAAGDHTVTAKINEDLQATIKANVVDPTSAVVNATVNADYTVVTGAGLSEKDLVTEVIKDSSPAKTYITVDSVVLSNGDTTFTITDSDYVTVKANISVEQRTTAGTYQIPFEVTYDDNEVETESVATINVVPATESKSELKGIRLTYSVTGEAYDEALKELPSSLFIDDEVTITVNKVYEKDGKESLSPVANGGYVIQAKTGDKYGAVTPETDGTIKITVDKAKSFEANIFVNDPELSQTQKATINIGAGKNAVVPMTTEDNLAIKQNMDVALASGSVPADLTPYVKLDDTHGLKNLNDEAKVEYTVTTDTVMDFEIPAQDAGTVKVYCYISYQGYEPVRLYKTVTLQYSAGQDA